MSVHYVPAGIEAYSGSPSQLYVSDKPNDEEKTKFSIKYKQWQLKDRTLTYVRAGTRKSIMHTANATAMVTLHCADFVKQCGLTKILANPIHKEFVREPFKAQGIDCIIDSGGFQMLKGTVDFVHPDDVIQRYNRTATIGMPLDLPVFGSVEHLYFHSISKMIKTNDDYILKRLNPGIDLALISHGTSLKLREQRLDVLDRKANVVAIAGLNIKPKAGVDHLYNSVENLMYVVHRYHKTTKYFHVLGVTSKIWFFIYALLDKSDYVQNIGGDSVSHRLGSLVGMYDQYDFKTLTLSRKTPYTTTLPCNCPVCSIVDDSRIIQETVLLEAHNLWVRAKQTELISNLASSFLKGEITLDAVHTCLGLSTGTARLKVIVDYIMSIVGSDKYKPLRANNKSSNLFSVDVPVKADPVRIKHYKEILTRYEKFHGKKFSNDFKK